MKLSESEQQAFLKESARILSSEMNLHNAVTHAIIRLLEQGATIPFIARYRKEMTGGMEETRLLQFQERWQQLQDLAERKQYILKTIADAGLLSPELQQKIENCFDPAILEDIYLPYKPKRKTRASVAREHGLEPLAELLYRQNAGPIEPLAAKYMSGDIDAALQGARDIIAEWISEHAQSRNALRQLCLHFL